MSSDEGTPRSFEAGIKLHLRRKSERDVMEEELRREEAELERLKEEERVRAVREQQKIEMFRLDEKTQQWVPPESDQDQNNSTCMESLCLHLRLHLAQFSHFSVRTVSPDFEEEDRKSDKDKDEKLSPAEPEQIEITPTIQVSSPTPESSPPSKRKMKRKDSKIQFGFSKPKRRDKSASMKSMTSIVENQGIIHEEAEEEEPEPEYIEMKEMTDTEEDQDKEDPNFLEEFWDTTKEAYGVHKAGAETLISSTNKVPEKVGEGLSSAVDTTVELAGRTTGVVQDATKDVPVHPFGKPKRKESQESEPSQVQKTDNESEKMGKNTSTNSSSSKSKSEPKAPSVQITEEPKQSSDNISVTPSKKKKRKSSVITFGFGNNKNKRKSSTKKPDMTPSAEPSLDATIQEMSILEEEEADQKPESEPPESVKVSEHDKESMASSKASSNIVQTFLTTTKEAFGTTKKGAESLVDKTNELKNSVMDHKQPAGGSQTEVIKRDDVSQV